MNFFILDLMLTLYFLGPVPWSLSTTNRISTKTDKSKLPHGLQLHIEPTLNWRCSAEHNFDDNAILQNIITFPFTFKDLGGTSIQPGTEAKACWFCH